MKTLTLTLTRQDAQELWDNPAFKEAFLNKIFTPKKSGSLEAAAKFVAAKHPVNKIAAIKELRELSRDNRQWLNDENSNPDSITGFRECLGLAAAKNLIEKFNQY